MYSKSKILNKKVERILKVLADLRKDKRYRACLVFGSVVRGEFKNGSDVDVKVIVKRGKEHSELNHLNIEGVKLDISFNSIEQLKKDTNKELERAKRVPIVSESIILFDKDGNLKKLVHEAKKKMSPRKYEKSRYDWVRFVILNEDLKVKRHLTNNPIAANYVMHSGLEDIIDMYYQIVGRWDTSNKKTLEDLSKWDPNLKNILVKIMTAKNTKDKFVYWTKMIDHVINKIGGRIDIEKTSCACEICQQDIGFLKSLIK